MTDTNPNIETETSKTVMDEFLAVDPAYEKRMNDRRNAEIETDIRSIACEHVVGLYLANATKNTNSSKTYVDMDKSVYDLVADSRHLVEYLKGLVD